MDNDVPGDTAEVRRLKAQINDLTVSDGETTASMVDILVHLAHRRGVRAGPFVGGFGVGAWRGHRHQSLRADRGAAGVRSRSATGGDEPDHRGDLHIYRRSGLTSEAVATISENRSLTPGRLPRWRP